jgi:tRNA pseudouridine13 synthase
MATLASVPSLPTPPILPGCLPLPRGRIKARVEDFVVDEIPAYTPSGEGEHVFVEITKTDVTTMDAVRALAGALGCDPRAAGFAGMKDRRATTTQTISLQPPRGTPPGQLAERARALTLQGITVRAATPHGNKLKPGHLAGNRFEIAVRDVPSDAIAGVEASLNRVAREGVPNAFGAQRFGRDGDNATRAIEWLKGTERGPRDPRMQRLLWSALQSAVFNAVLDARVADSSWNTALAGDLLKLRSSGGLFVCTDVDTDRQRAAAGEVSPTGPIPGAESRPAEGEPGQLERRVTAVILGEDFDFGRTRRLGEGSRRALRVWVQDLRWSVEVEDDGHRAACFRVYFVLPKGAYATTVLSTVFDLEARERDEEEQA